jgi:ComF family protein
VIAHAAGWVLDALAPRRCAGCDRAGAEIICEACAELTLGLPVPSPMRHGAVVCRAALLYAPPVTAVIHRAKYRGCRQAMHVLAAIACERLAPHLLFLPAPDLVVPVPLARGRHRARGYNQAEVVARALAGLARGAPVTSGLRRRRETEAQVGQDRTQRRRNLDDAFAWVGPPLGGATLWLVDDVVTTGATMAAATGALQQGGAGRIEAVAVAATPG